jgi:hypothetical protein
MYLVYVSLKRILRLVSVCTPVAGLWVHEGARVGLHLHMLGLDVCGQSLLLPKCLVTWREVGAVELGLVDILVSLQPAVGSEALPTALPVAYKSSLGGRVAMSVLEVSLKMVFAGERLVAAGL